MSNNAIGTQSFQELEAERIHSEIQRNNAQRDRLRQTSIWPRLFASIVVIMTLVFAFLGFFTDFYQIAITDRNAVRSENEKLLATIKTLSDDVQKLFDR